jgi:hypothetical protein
MNDDELSTVLYLVNRGRVALGRPARRTLPKGSPETLDCVVGRALNLGVEYMTFCGKREYYVRCRDWELATKLAQVWRATPRWLGGRLGGRRAGGAQRVHHNVRHRKYSGADSRVCSESRPTGGVMESAPTMVWDIEGALELKLVDGGRI